MKIKTNAGEVELTAEMVCRGMVFAPKDPRDYCLGEGRVFVVGHRDDANGVWRDARDENLGTNVLGADRLLGCDPTIASRADCERFGVHGDAAAHGFARLRDGGAVDLRHVLMPVGAISQRRDEERIVLPLTPGTERLLFDGERFVGLHAIYASPEDVRRLCCGAEDMGPARTIGKRTVCTLAVGDHEQHEDLATGVKWGAGADRYLSDVARVDAAVRTVSMFNANLRASAALPAGPSCGCCGGATEPSRIGPTMLVLPVGDCLTAEAPICRSCLAEVNDDIAAWTIRDGKIERKAKRTVLDIASGKALDGLALLYDEKRRAGETCEDLRARLRGLRFGNGFHVGVGVDPARHGTEATAFVSAVMRKAGESLAAVGEAAKRCAESAMLAPPAMRYITNGEHAARGFCAFVDGLKRWAALCSCGALGPDIADNLHAVGCRTVRSRREAPLVALVAAVPEGLDPIGWRAAVLAVHECQSRYGSAIQGDHLAAWLMHSLREGMDDCDAGTSYAYGYHGYLRAIAPAPKVDRVRATWKTRAPVLPCDNGEDE